MARRPFNMLAGVFYLLAAIILLQVISAIAAGFLCFYINIITIKQIGACIPVTAIIREQWDKIFEALLALMVAAVANRPPGSSPPSSPAS